MTNQPTNNDNNNTKNPIKWLRTIASSTAKIKSYFERLSVANVDRQNTMVDFFRPVVVVAWYIL